MSTKLVLAAVCCCLAASVHAATNDDVVISEFMASNTHTYPDENNLFPDWIELHNTTFSNINRVAGI